MSIGTIERATHLSAQKWGGDAWGWRDFPDLPEWMRVTTEDAVALTVGGVAYVRATGECVLVLDIVRDGGQIDVWVQPRHRPARFYPYAELRRLRHFALSSKACRYIQPWNSTTLSQWDRHELSAAGWEIARETAESAWITNAVWHDIWHHLAGMVAAAAAAGLEEDADELFHSLITDSGIIAVIPDLNVFEVRAAIRWCHNVDTSTWGHAQFLRVGLPNLNMSATVYPTDVLEFLSGMHAYRRLLGCRPVDAIVGETRAQAESMLADARARCRKLWAMLDVEANERGWCDSYESAVEDIASECFRLEPSSQRNTEWRVSVDVECSVALSFYPGECSVCGASDGVSCKHCDRRPTETVPVTVSYRLTVEAATKGQAENLAVDSDKVEPTRDAIWAALNDEPWEEYLLETPVAGLEVRDIEYFQVESVNAVEIELA